MSKKTSFITFIGFLAILIAYIGFRNLLLHKILDHTLTRIEKKLSCHITYQKAAFIGIKSFYIKKLTVVILSKDTLIAADSMIINPRLIPLITAHFRLKDIGLYRANLKITDFTYRILTGNEKRNSSDSLDNHHTHTYPDMINSVQTRLLTWLPSNIIVRSSWISYINDSLVSSVYCENFSYLRSNFTGDLFLCDQLEKKRCLLTGVLDVDHRIANISITHPDSSIIKVPILSLRWKSMIGFNSLNFAFRLTKIDQDLHLLSGEAMIKDLSVFNEHISPDLVSVKKTSIQFMIKIGKHHVELDSSSSITINQFTFSSYIRYEKSDKHMLQFAFKKQEFEASDLFESFPTGLFTNFKGLKTTGRLAYSMRAGIDFSHPDSVWFESKLENKGFEIINYGVTNFKELNQEYNQDLYDKDQYVKTILVGPDNPDFVSLQDISPYLKYSVLTSEDGDFYYHRGFNAKAFRESIVANIKAKRFVRGGSTITMQLVKNAFLSRNKTISRKIEEALIVWMIENLHLVSKERMFEVYLNIIEWGPGVYGIKPAAKFYFNKLPDALTLSESIFLSSIIPRPKGFRYAFISNGEMAGFYPEYCKLLSNIMLKRNQITTEDSAKLKSFVILNGVAKTYLAAPDTIHYEDSLYYKEPKLIDY